ncbi:MAG: flagellar motor protein MotB, partial [Desulfobacterales bacterium]
LMPAPEVTEALPLLPESEIHSEISPAIQNEPVTAWVDQLAADVTQLLDDRGDQAFAVRWEARRPVIVLGEQITFNEGTAELLTPFMPVLGTIAQRLAEHPDYQIEVAGHTDDTPIHTSQYPSNWELSAARAVNVARFLIERGVNPQRVSFEGFAEFQPLAPNTTAAQRQRNRRVEISLLGRENR